MRICIAIGNFFAIGGTEVNTRYLTNHLKAFGHKVCILSFLGRKDASKSSLKVYYCIKDKSNVTRNDAETSSGLTLKSIVLNTVFSFFMFIATLVIAFIEKADIFHAQMVIPTGLPVVLASKLVGKPVVVSARGSDLNVLAKNLILRSFAKYTLKEASAVIVLSSGLRDMALRYGAAPENVYLIPNGVEVSSFNKQDKKEARIRLQIRDTCKVILFVGTISSYRRRIKNIDLFLELCKSILKKVPELQSICVGVPLSNKLAAKAKELKVESHVRFEGILPHERIPMYYSASDLVVLTSLSEGLPTAILEAMASGRPVVASDIPGCRDLIIDGVNGFLVRPNDMIAFASRIIQILEDQMLASSLGLNGYRIAKASFTWPSVATQTLKVYQHITRPK